MQGTATIGDTWDISTKVMSSAWLGVLYEVMYSVRVWLLVLTLRLTCDWVSPGSERGGLRGPVQRLYDVARL